MAKDSKPDPGSVVQPGKAVEPPPNGGVHPPTPDFDARGGNKSWFGGKR